LSDVKEIEVGLDAVNSTRKDDDGWDIVVMLGPCELLLKHSERSKELCDARHEKKKEGAP